MEDEWDADKVEKDDLDPISSNKWEGEDEDDEVLESWEDVDNEEKKDVEKPAETQQKAQPKPKKIKQDKIEARERRDREEEERKAREKEEAMTPEERRAEMLRRQKLQEEADLRLAMETFGVKELNGLDSMNPDTAEEFKDFGDALLQKINEFNKHAEYNTFAEELIKNISLSLPAASLKKIKTTVESLHNEKQKMEKERSKKAAKGKGKATIKVEGDGNYGDYAAFENDYDDFM